MAQCFRGGGATLKTKLKKLLTLWGKNHIVGNHENGESRIESVKALRSNLSFTSLRCRFRGFRLPDFCPSAFTLAEVLITLTILGIIAALVIPNMVQRYNERVTVSKVKKIYSTFSDAIAQAQTLNGSVLSWDIGTNDSKAGAEKVYNYIAPNLQVSKYCGTTTSTNEACFASQYKILNGKYNAWTNVSNNDKFCKFILKDGTHVAFWSNGKEKCKQDNGSCVTILFDINGKKGPNRTGIDLFGVNVLGNNGLTYTLSTQCSYNDNNNYSGRGCIYWIFKKGNMDYLRRDISND